MTGADFSGIDIDLLADYIGGVLTGTPEESVVAARIADDPAWLAAYESLGEGMSFVSAELGRLAPEPMPTDLADRLDTLLTSFVSPDAATSAGEANHTSDAVLIGDLGPADEAAQLSSAEHSAEATQLDRADRATQLGETDTEAGEAEGSRAGRGGVDAEPVGDGLGVQVGRQLSLVRGDLAVGDGAQGVRETQPAPRRGRRLRWAAPIAVAAGLVAFVGFGLDYLAGRSTEKSSSDSAGVAAAGGEAQQFSPQAGTTRQLASGIDYSHATLGTAPVQPMTAPLASPGEQTRKSVPDVANGVEPALQRLASPTALANCLAAIEQANSGGSLVVESVDYARFAGAPAVIIRFSATNGQWAWASGADCGTQSAGAATLDKVPVG